MTLDVLVNDGNKSSPNPIQIRCSWLSFSVFSPAWAEQHNAARKLFPMRVPQPFVRLMEKGNEQDPVAFASHAVNQRIPNNCRALPMTPLAEAEHSPVPGLLAHKYQSRVLMIILRGGCARELSYIASDVTFLTKTIN